MAFRPLRPPIAGASRTWRSRGPPQSPLGEAPRSSASSARVAASSRNTAQAAVPCPRSPPRWPSGSSSPGSPAPPTPSTTHRPTTRVHRVRRGGSLADVPGFMPLLAFMSNSSVIVHDLDVARPFVRPMEADAPLRVDPNAVLTDARSPRSASSRCSATRARSPSVSALSSRTKRRGA